MAVMVVRAGPLHSSIQALMKTMPQIQIVAEAKEVSALLNMDPEVRPDLVLLEAELGEDELGLVTQAIKEKWSGTRLIVLVDNDKQRRIAKESEADAVMLKGFRAGKFVEEVESLLRIKPVGCDRS